ncbi:MAG: ABC-F family ATP-binding cassette domain-containing protein [Lachnospiraceae bacterium]
MNILTADQITKSFTDRKLFNQTSFFLQKGEKIGIIGINGTGKSTLLKMLAGYESPDEGQIIRANHIVIHYLPQNPEFDPEDTTLEAVEKMAAFHATANEHAEAKTILTKLGITDFAKKTKELSGGQRKRLALAAVLLTDCDVLILDEPTNHIDSEMAEWLEGQLKSFRGAILMVTHDRYFLDSITNRIIEIDQGSIYSYQENYSGFLIRKAEREDSEMASERKRQSILRKEIAWMQRGARARSTKQKAHIKRFEELNSQNGIEVQSRIELSAISSRMGRSTIELKDICMAYDEQMLIQNFTYTFLKKDRVGFVGRNGSGKSTLMKLISGELAPVSGSIEIGSTIKIGYYAQEFEAENKSAGISYMDPNQKVIDYIKTTAEFVRTTDGLVSASAMLERFLFPPESQYNRIGKLSGGEKRRLNLLRVLMEAPNVLILDEPTNDLDVETMTILEDYLDQFEGIVIMVSHDRYFLDRVARRIFFFEENAVIRQYEGGFTDFWNRRKQEESEGQAGMLKPDTVRSNEGNGSERDSMPGISDSRMTRAHEKKLKFSFQEKKDYETIEEEILTLESKIEWIETQILSASSDFIELGKLTKQKEAVDQLLLEKMERWEYLEELATAIAEQDK